MLAVDEHPQPNQLPSYPVTQLPNYSITKLPNYPIQKMVLMDAAAQSSTRVSSFMRNIDGSDWLRNPELEVVQTTKDKGPGSNWARGHGYIGGVVKPVPPLTLHPIADGVYWVNQHVIDNVLNYAGRGARVLGRYTYEYVDQRGVEIVAVAHLPVVRTEPGVELNARHAPKVGQDHARGLVQGVV